MLAAVARSSARSHGSGQSWERANLTSPLGPLTLVTDAMGRLRAVYWSDHAERGEAALARQSRHGEHVLNEGVPGANAVELLTGYFDGEDRLVDIPMIVGGTRFQQAVWTALLQIPPACPVSYASLAEALGFPRAVRAVGAANGANPIPIAVPCHRVIASGGALGGYGGGLERKRWLLDHERRWSSSTRPGRLFD